MLFVIEIHMHIVDLKWLYTSIKSGKAYNQIVGLEILNILSESRKVFRVFSERGRPFSSHDLWDKEVCLADRRLSKHLSEWGNA